MAEPLRVGIIGANARGGWAGEAHVPALQALAGFELAAVATSDRETAEEAAHAFGVAKAYASGISLIDDPNIDVVTVATRVPYHRELVLAALATGKHVYCEWPLGRGSGESAAMARAAADARVHHAIGLQLRESPAVRAARNRLSSGSIGRLLTLRAFAATAGFGPQAAPHFGYLEDPANFANLVTIQAAHTLDLMLAVGGAPALLAALTSRQYPSIRIGEDRPSRPRSTFDHVAAHGRFENGATLVMEVVGGRKDDTPFFLDIVGESGSLRLEGGAPRGPQAGRIELIEDGKRRMLDGGELSGLPDSAVNVAGVYAALRGDISNDKRTVPGFGHAVRLTRLVEAVMSSSEQGRTLLGGELPA